MSLLSFCGGCTVTVHESLLDADHDRSELQSQEIDGASNSLRNHSTQLRMSLSRALNPDEYVSRLYLRLSNSDLRLMSLL